MPNSIFRAFFDPTLYLSSLAALREDIINTILPRDVVFPNFIISVTCVRMTDDNCSIKYTRNGTMKN